jgi:adenylate kinase family enzyme
VPLHTSLTRDLAIQRLTAVDTALNKVLLSLLKSFNATKSRFPSNVEENSLGFEENYRNTAIVLAMIEAAKEAAMESEPRRGPALSAIQDLFMRQTQDSKIYHDEYSRLYLRPALKDLLRVEDQTARGKDRILRRIFGPVRKSRNALDRNKPPRLEEDNAFTSACILQLLNLLDNSEQYPTVYMHALNRVLEALCTLKQPSDVFGGASLTTEPHAFVSFVCLRSIASLRRVFKSREQQYRIVARLLGEAFEWYEGKQELNLRYGDWSSFRLHFVERIAEIPLPSPIMKQISRNYSQIKKRPSLERFIGVLFAALGEDAWMQAFMKAIIQQNRRISGELRVLLKRSGRRTKKLDPTVTLNEARMGLSNAGILWRRYFFDYAFKIFKDLKSKYVGFKRAQHRGVILKDKANSLADEWENAGVGIRNYLANFAKWSAAEINHQLASHAADLKSNFDASQLAFALRINNDISVFKDDQLLQAGLKLVLDSQRADGTWSVGVPFAEYKDFAISVSHLEIINSLEPLIRQYGGLALHNDSYDRIYHWLTEHEKSVTCRVSGMNISGWHHGRPIQRVRVDIWLNALALEFLRNYRILLEEFVTRTTAAHYSATAGRIAWDNLHDPELSRKPSAGAKPREPVLPRIYNEYIKPFGKAGENRKNAMVLFGPPGTAKTTLAAAIAQKLSWNFLTITPSDFVRRGIEMSEHRARIIFSDLMCLRETVILFDEIDEMLRSRKDPHPSPIAMLRFLIPGMLPKFQNLKQHGEKNRVIIVIATNYRERLDPAIVRRGRIDDEFLILPPDDIARQYQLHQLVLRKGWNPDSSTMKSLVSFLVQHTRGWMYKELEMLVDVLGRNQLIPNPSNLPTWVQLFPEVRKLTQAGHKWQGPSICGLQRDLNLKDTYEGRKGATKEAEGVLSVCFPDKSPDDLRELCKDLLL